MSQTSPVSLRWLLPLTLLSGGGLLALALVLLTGSIREARRSAESAAGREAELLAERIKGSLLDPRSLAAAEPWNLFAIEGGEVQVSDRVRRVGPAPSLPGPRDWNDRTVEVVALAETYVQRGRVTEALPLFRQALAQKSDNVEARKWVLLTFGWFQWHSDQHEVDEAVLAELAEDTGSRHPEVVAGVLLLLARCGRDLPDWALKELTFFSREEGEGVWRRLREVLPGRRDELDSWRERWQQVLSERRLLERARELRETLVVQTVPLLLEWSEGVLCYVPEQQGQGRGWFQDGSRLEQRFATVPGALGPRVVVARERPAGGVLAVPSVWVLADEQGSRTSGGEAWLLPGSLVVLVLLLLGGTWQSARTVRREQALVRAQSDFLTTVTHELKTPLAAIRLLTEMLVDGRVASDDKRFEYYQRLEREAERLQVLIENVLEVGRMSRGEREYRLEGHSLDEVMLESIDRFKPVAEKAGLEVEASLQERCRGRVDRAALMQAFLNVLDNARKYARAGRRLVVRGVRRGDRYEWSVRDFGPGVLPGEREEIFQRFRRGSAQRTGTIPGVGVGLGLARSILRAHGGELRCVAPSDGGGGACFVAHVPLHQEGEA